MRRKGAKQPSGLSEKSVYATITASCLKSHHTHKVSLVIKSTTAAATVLKIGPNISKKSRCIAQASTSTLVVRGSLTGFVVFEFYGSTLCV